MSNNGIQEVKPLSVHLLGNQNYQLPAEGAGLPRNRAGLLKLLGLPANYRPPQDIYGDMCKAIRDNDLETLTKLINNLYIRDKYDLLDLVLDYTASKANKTIANYIFNLPDFDLNRVNYEGYTPLMTAIRAGNEATFELLINFVEVDINKVTQEERIGFVVPPPNSALQVALDFNRDKFILRLLNLPEVEINDRIIDAFIAARKVDLLIQAHNLDDDDIVKIFQRAKGTMSEQNILHAVGRRAAGRRLPLLKEYEEAHADEAAEMEAYGLQFEAAHLREQLAAPELTPAQKAGIAARARALTKKANNLTRNKRRRRNTRKGRK